jgi:hypothetical protein
MTINNMIKTLKRDVIRAFATLDEWFDKDESFFHYEPPNEQAHAFDIVKRITAVNDHLLSLINNGCKQALKQAQLNAEQLIVDDYTFQSMSIEDPAVNDFLNRLHHSGVVTEPNSLETIREALRDQLYRSLCQLELLRHGEGALHSTSLHESHSHKIDIYQLIHLLTVNIWRNVMQLKKLEGVNK